MGWFTHVVADEATQGIDPAAQEQSLRLLWSCVAGKIWPHDSIFGAGFDRPVITHSCLVRMSVARPMGWCKIVTSGTKAWESEVNGWRQCESLLSSLSGLTALRTTNTPASCSRNLRPKTRTVVSRHICHCCIAPAAVSKSQKGSTRSHASCSCIICPQA